MVFFKNLKSHCIVVNSKENINASFFKSIGTNKLTNSQTYKLRN